MTDIEQVLADLQALARPQELAGMARFGMDVSQRLGVSVPDLRRIAKSLGHDQALAQQLWDSGWADARIVAALVAQPAQFSSRQMDAWVKDFNSWDVCDQVCNNAFVASPLAWGKVPVWAKRQNEFARRAAFSLLASLAVHDKKADDAPFVQALALVEDAASDERNFVKKAVNWALRNIGKRNAELHTAAITSAQRIQQQGTKSARWIAADALRELQSDAVLKKVRHVG